MHHTKTVEQRLSELIKMECPKWILKDDKEIILAYDCENLVLEDPELYNKILIDIEIISSEAFKEQDFYVVHGFLYGKSAKMAKNLYGETPQYFISFTQEKWKQEKKSNLAELRIKADMTQAQLAIKSGVSIATIRNYEQNPDTIIVAQYQTLKILSQVLGVEIKDILPSDGMPFSLEQLYPSDEMAEAVKIIKEYISGTSNNKCIFITGPMGSGVTTVTRCLENYIEGSAVIGDRLIIQDVHAENREILCVRLGMTKNMQIIDSITLLSTHKNNIEWKYGEY